MARSGRHDDDPAWGDTTPRDGKRKRDPAVLHRIREDFWRACAEVPLSVPRWESIPRMHANLKWLLEGGEGRPAMPEEVVKASFRYFRNELEALDLSPATDCWAVYFARKSRYLAQVVAAQAGARDPQATRTVGDIAVDQQRRRRRRIVGRQE